MTSRTRLLSIAVGVLGGTAGLFAPSAFAGEPVAQCPPSYTLFAIPTDGSRPVAAQLDAAGNADGYACELPFSAGAAAHTGSPYNVIENRVPSRG